MHHEMRELPVYAMVVSDGGLKVTESDPATRGNIAAAKGRLDVRKVSMANVARVLSLSLNQPVLDKTSLTGRYTFHLEWDVEGDPGWSLSIAMQNQLGLRLDLQRGPVEVLVVDRVHRPRRIDGNFARRAQFHEQCERPSSLWRLWRDLPGLNCPQSSMLSL